MPVRSLFNSLNKDERVIHNCSGLSLLVLDAVGETREIFCVKFDLG